MDETRRGFLKAAVTAAGAAATPDVAHAQGPGQDPGHEHQAVPSDLTLRVKSLESLLVEKGLVDPAALDALVDTMEHKVGPRNGARVVARAWVDPAYKKRLLENAPAAIAELGYTSGQGEHMVVVENGPKVHNLIVCTLCSCYPWPVLGLPPVWYKSAPYRSRAVIDPRGILREFGTQLAEDVEVRVWDSTAELRYIVLPERPAGTETMTEEQLAALITRDAMVGVAKVALPTVRRQRMNGVHDMGGQQGMGPVEYEKNEPVFPRPLGGASLRAHPCDAGLAQVEPRRRPARTRTSAPGRLFANELLRALVPQARSAGRAVWLRDQRGDGERKARLRARRKPLRRSASRRLPAGSPGASLRARIRTSDRCSRCASACAPATSIPPATRACRGTRAARPASSSAITVSTSFPTPTPIFRVRNASTSTPCVSLHGSCGGKTRRRATRFISTCGMTTLSEPSLTSSAERLSDLPRLPRDEGGPVFAEPWQAQAFALAVKLSEQGHFTWKEWAAALANELQAAARRGEPDDGSRYYEHWLAALERLVTAKGLANPTALLTRKEAWADAYRNTPHGQPVELLQSPARPTRAGFSLGSRARSRRTGCFSTAECGAAWRSGSVPTGSPPVGIRRERRSGRAARHAARARAGSSRCGVDPHDGRA